MSNKLSKIMAKKTKKQELRFDAHITCGEVHKIASRICDERTNQMAKELVDNDFSNIGHPYIYLDIFDEQFDTRTKAVNTALKKFIEYWKERNPNVKKDDEAVAKAKSLIIMDEHYFENTSAKKGEVIQLSLFDF